MKLKIAENKSTNPNRNDLSVGVYAKLFMQNVIVMLVENSLLLQMLF